MKRHTAEREAGISKLPAPILQHILSFLSLEESVKTCVLSKSWRYLGSTRPKFSLSECDFEGDKEKFRNVLDKSLQVYYDQKFFLEDFGVSSVSNLDPELISLLKKWIPIVTQDLGAKKFHLSFRFQNSPYFDLPSVVFESESLQEINLERCNLSQIKSIGNKNLKTLLLYDVYIKEESFAKLMSSCPLIERFSLSDCKGFRTIKMHDHHNLKSFELDNSAGSTDIDLCPSWFPGLTCLILEEVALSNEWFDSFSHNFPCLEDLSLSHCFGFDVLKLSSRSITDLDIMMDESTIKADIDAPIIKKFHYDANISQSISFTTTSSEWNSHFNLSLDIDSSLWFLNLSELATTFSQSQVSLTLFHSGREIQYIEHLSDISVCCGGSFKPVAVKSLDLHLEGRYYDSFFSDLVNGLFRIFRPREIKRSWYNNAQQEHEKKNNEAVEFLCRTLQMGRWEEEDEGVRSFIWQQDLEQVSLQVHSGDFHEEWHPVQGITTSWLEYVSTLSPLGNMGFCQLRFRLKWRE